ncbi:NAD(P)-dependent oxidoreductase [Salinibacterium sp. ZJ70]|uniref:NAD-dependent epimerase/dehydratase family protein n=1 Tax=Salinibacterium sp. ZJ70 TaxID=2708084 RepID=UPI001CD1CA8A|nr:NAD-dependent epimerase/dehydratase family protein [Salinibacterium sp. ZJ70]
MTLVVGGTGMVGSAIARHLHEAGRDVVIMARRPEGPDDPRAVARLKRIVGDYLSPQAIGDQLDGIDSVVFAAGHDIRHVPADVDTLELWERVQGAAVPAFARVARDAGVSRFVQIGSYYHQARPELRKLVPYVEGRARADERTRELSTDRFAAITLNPPSIVGVVPGRAARRFARLISALRGEGGASVVAPPGGTNYMTADAVAQATLGALEQGESGRAYLIGDENLTYREYFQRFADAARSAVRVEEHDEDSRWQPDRFIVQGRGQRIAYEPASGDVDLLGYQRGGLDQALETVVRLSDEAVREAAQSQS